MEKYIKTFVEYSSTFINNPLYLKCTIVFLLCVIVYIKIKSFFKKK